MSIPETKTTGFTLFPNFMKAFGPDYRGNKDMGTRRPGLAGEGGMRDLT